MYWFCAGGYRVPPKNFMGKQITGTNDLAYLGGSLVGVRNGWGYGIAFFRALNFQISEPEIWQKIALSVEFKAFPWKFRPLKKQISDSGKWPFHTPPIHTPTKCRPIIWSGRSYGPGLDWKKWKNALQLVLVRRFDFPAHELFEAYADGTSIRVAFNAPRRKRFLKGGKPHLPIPHPRIHWIPFSVYFPLSSANSDLPLPHGLAPSKTMVWPWSQSPLWALQALGMKHFLCLERPFLDLVSSVASGGTSRNCEESSCWQCSQCKRLPIHFFRCHNPRALPGKPNQRKVSSWTFHRGILEQKFYVNRACFPKEKHQNSQKWAKFMSFFVLALSLIWFAGATPDFRGRNKPL